MKKIALVLVLVIGSIAAKAQTNPFPSLDSLERFINRYIRNSAVEAFTQLRMNTAMIGLVRFMDEVQAAGGVDTMYRSGDSLKLETLTKTFTVYIGGGGGGSLSMVGSGYRLLVTNGTQVRTLFGNSTITIDSSSNSNGLTFKVDTSVIATKSYVDLNSGGTVSEPSAQVFLGTGSGKTSSANFKYNTTHNQLDLTKPSSGGLADSAMLVFDNNLNNSTIFEIRPAVKNDSMPVYKMKSFANANVDPNAHRTNAVIQYGFFDRPPSIPADEWWSSYEFYEPWWVSGGGLPYIEWGRSVRDPSTGLYHRLLFSEFKARDSIQNSEYNYGLQGTAFSWADMRTSNAMFSLVPGQAILFGASGTTLRIWDTTGGASTYSDFQQVGLDLQMTPPRNVSFTSIGYLSTFNVGTREVEAHRFVSDHSSNWGDAIVDVNLGHANNTAFSFGRSGTPFFHSDGNDDMFIASGSSDSVDLDATVDLMARVRSTGKWVRVAAGGAGLSGSGTDDRIAVWTGGSTLGNSLIRDNGSYTAIGGSVVSGNMLDVQGGNSRFDLYDQSGNGKIGSFIVETPSGGLDARIGFVRDQEGPNNKWVFLNYGGDKVTFNIDGGTGTSMWDFASGGYYPIWRINGDTAMTIDANRFFYFGRTNGSERYNFKGGFDIIGNGVDAQDFKVSSGIDSIQFDGITHARFRGGLVDIGTQSVRMGADISTGDAFNIILGNIASTSIPAIGINALSAGTDEKRWRVYNNSGVFTIDATNDAVDAASAALRFNRTGGTVTSVELPNGNVGIGVSPTSKFHVSGNSLFDGLIKITGGSPGSGKVLTSDADGDATWQTPSASGNYIANDGNSTFSANSITSLSTFNWTINQNSTGRLKLNGTLSGTPIYGLGKAADSSIVQYVLSVTDRYEGTTSDATPVTIATITPNPSAHEVITVSVTIEAIRTDDVGGYTANKERSFHWEEAGTTLTNGTLFDMRAESFFGGLSTADITITNSGDDIIVQFTGEASESIYYVVFVTVRRVTTLPS